MKRITTVRTSVTAFSFLFTVTAVALAAQNSTIITKTSSSSSGSSSANTSSTKTSRVRKTAHHRARNVRRFVSKPKGSSFGDPTAGDDTSGEDLIVRQAAVDALGNLMGSMVAVDPTTGRILTVVNQKMAFESGYQPCSTFKPAVALAALEEGVITNDSTRLRLGKSWYLDLKESLARSNNMYFAKLGTMLGLNKMREYAEEFGFASPAVWGVEKEAHGSFPTQPPPESMGGVGKVASFGEGISQTLFQLVSFVSAVSNGGTLYYLQYPRTPEEMENFQPRVKRQLNIEQWLTPVREGMMDAVLFGTARRAKQPDMPVLGKTGTCSQDGMKLGWFAGYAQRDGGLAVAVLQRTSQPMGGGPHAAEIAGRFFRTLANEKYFIRHEQEQPKPAMPTVPAASIQLFQ